MENTENPVVQEDRAPEEATEQSVDVPALQAELARAKEQCDHCMEQWKRCEADLQNYRRRVDKERGEWIETAVAASIGRLLPVLDDLERAFRTLPPQLGQLSWIEGVGLVERKLLMILEQQGLKEIEALGMEFNPASHQAILEQETDETPDGHVMAVLQKGYSFNARVLRPALVQVARAPATGNTETQGEMEDLTNEPEHSGNHDG